MNNMLLRRRIMLGLASSPFSPEATAILKEDFPDEWNDIKAYGYANPEMVPYINEDPYFVTSLGLVSDVLRKLISDTAYIETTLIPYGNLWCEVVFDMINKDSNYNIFGSRTSNGNQQYILMIINTATPNYLRIDYNNERDTNTTNININTKYIYKFENYKAYLNNSLIKTFVSTTSSFVYPIYLFVVNNAGNLLSSNLMKSLYSAKFYNISGDIANFLPFIRNNKYGMLDIITGTFYPNANSTGAFTIEYSGRPYLNITSTTKTYIINTYGESAWNTVKEFFTNPDNEYLVKYVNEDPDIVCNLVDIGYTRYLVGDGTAYLETNFVRDLDDAIKIDWKFKRNDINISPFSERTTQSDSSGIFIQYRYQTSNFRVSQGTINGGEQFVDVNITALPNTLYKQIITKDTFTSNGTTITTGISATGTPTAPVMLFKLANSSFVYECQISKVECENKCYLVPCKNLNGSDYGMLDIVNDVFYPNSNSSGAFTISIEQNN